MLITLLVDLAEAMRMGISHAEAVRLRAEGKPFVRGGKNYVFKGTPVRRKCS